MQQAQTESRDRSVAYTETREYQLSASGSQKPDSKVVAEVNFVPPAGKEYTIVQTQGSDRGANVVRKVLDRESHMAGQTDQHAITPSNYDLTLLGREALDGRDCYVLQLIPKRREVDLVRGKAWVDAASFRILRIEGETAKSPSWWIKNLQVTLNYGELNGVWVQNSTHAVADVRLIGTHVLNSRDVDLRTASVTARAIPPQPHIYQRPRSRRAVDNTATWVPR